MPLIDTLPAPSIPPICPYFYECGGCDLQDVPYAEQIVWKDSALRNLFSTVPGTWQPFLQSPEKYPVYFRNKIRFSFIPHDGRLWPSRHRKGKTVGDIAVDTCFLQSETTMALVNWVAHYASSIGWSAYDPTTGQGWLKHVLIREGKYTGDLMLCLVTGSGHLQDPESFIHAMRANIPQVTSLYQIITKEKDVLQHTDIHLWGNTTIQESIGENSYQISPHAFFQTNSNMVQTLYDRIKELVHQSQPRSVWDLYAGSATIGIHIRSVTQNVICIENNPQNIVDATQNITANNADNVTIVGESVESALSSQFFKIHGRPDVIIVDPPRAGLSEQTRTVLSGIRPNRLIYVSCNPLTCLRDTKDLLQRGFNIVSLQGVDMFPHTVHSEMILVFEGV